MQISILNVTISTKPTKTGKSYQEADIAYKNLSFGGKVEGKKLLSFGAQAETFKTLANAQTGQAFEVDVVKNDKGYNDWVKATEAVPGSTNTQQAAAATGAATRLGATQAPRSTYETPEERAQKQVYIIRQSSISSAIDLLGTNSKAALKVEDVLEVAKRFEDYVFGKASPGPSGFDDFEDVPFDKTEVNVD